MNTNISIRRALLSVSNKSGIVEFAKALHLFQIEIISTGGTAKVIQEAGIPVTSIDAVTGFPEMLDGRVKTLHPKVHGGLLGIRDNQEHVQAMLDHEIEPIDLVCIDLYPFEETISKENVEFVEVIEQIDIGGPSMIRSAAKNHQFVTVITNVNQYQEVLEELDTQDGFTSLSLRTKFAQLAFERTATYDRVISNWMLSQQSGTPTHQVSGEQLHKLRYGENPNQVAYVFSTKESAGANIIDSEMMSGKPLSYNNYMDSAAALDLVQDLQKQTSMPSVAIIKHANPCGAAIAPNTIDAFQRAWSCDPLAAFGGIVASSEPIEQNIADRICEGEKFLEVIVAPSFTQKAIDTLSSRWKNIRLLEVGDESKPNSWLQLKTIAGGFLTQECHPIHADTTNWNHVAGPTPSDEVLKDAQVAWIACAHLKSNSISIVSNGCLIGSGMGQVDRVSAANLAIERAGTKLQEATNAVAGSDAFFPFPDGPALLIEAGITCIVQPGGSVRDQETIDLCNDKDVTLLHTGERCFRH